MSCIDERIEQLFESDGDPMNVEIKGESLQAILRDINSRVESLESTTTNKETKNENSKNAVVPAVN